MTGTRAYWYGVLGTPLLLGFVLSTPRWISGELQQAEKAAAQEESAPAQEEAPVQEPLEAPPAQADDPPAPTSRYRFLEDRDALLSAWMGRGRVERLELGESAGGLELFGVQFGGRGPTPLAERTTVLLLGGLDGTSLSGSEAVLAITDLLLSQAERLPPNVTFVAVPWANPDGLARWLALGCGGGRNGAPLDDDDDGKADEDAPDDLDGDGVILEMLIEDPAGEWVHGPDPRFLRPAREGEAPRYRRTREGRDDDGDGDYNEDPPGGVVLDLNFPVGWAGPWTGFASGPWPLSEPAAKRLADFAIARRVALVLVFQGNHGLLATPGGSEASGGLELPFVSDHPTFDQVVDLFRRTTQREQEAPLLLREARQAGRPGAAIDWFYAARGALAMEVAVWGPEVEGTIRDTVDAQYVRDAANTDDPETDAVDLEDTSPADRAWARWLDDTRGGIGFVDWHPVELGEGKEGWVGGWEPWTCFNPPPVVLPYTVKGLDAFTLELAESLPRLEIELLETSRNGRIAMLSVRVRNAGHLPSGVGPECTGLGASLALELPDGIELLAGERENALGHLPGDGSSQVYTWLVLAPPETPYRLVCSSPWSPPTVLEKRL